MIAGEVLHRLVEGYLGKYRDKNLKNKLISHSLCN